MGKTSVSVPKSLLVAKLYLRSHVDWPEYSPVDLSQEIQFICIEVNIDLQYLLVLTSFLVTSHGSMLDHQRWL